MLKGQVDAREISPSGRNDGECAKEATFLFQKVMILKKTMANYYFHYFYFFVTKATNHVFAL